MNEIRPITADMRGIFDAQRAAFLQSGGAAGAGGAAGGRKITRPPARPRAPRAGGEAGG
jgi:hypothetical protein